MGGAIGARLVATGTRLDGLRPRPGQGAPLWSAWAPPPPPPPPQPRRRRARSSCRLNAPRIVRAAVFGPGGVAEGARARHADHRHVLDRPRGDEGPCRRRRRQGPALGGQPAVRRHPQGRDRGADPDAGRRRPRTWPTLRRSCRKVASNQTHMGGPGAGQTTKLINQVLCGLDFMAVAEATALAEAAGVDATMIPKALTRRPRRQRDPAGIHAPLRRPRLSPHRADRQHGQGPERRAGPCPPDPHLHAPDRPLRRDPPHADRRRPWRRGSGRADGILQSRTAKGPVQ